MLAYIARRLLLAVFTVWAISVLSFVVIQVPEGDAADRVIDDLMSGGCCGTANLEQASDLRAYLGLDDPYWHRYGRWIWRLMHGDLGLTFT